MREWTVDISAVKDIHPLFARSYQMAAFHSYYRPKDDEVFKLAGLDRVDFYDFLEQARPKGHAYIILRKEDKIPVSLLASYDFNNPKVLPSGMMLFELAPRAVAVGLPPKPKP
jgi:hypothetical protein